MRARGTAVAIEQFQFGHPQQIMREIGLLNRAVRAAYRTRAAWWAAAELQMMLEKNLRMSQ